MSFRKRPISLLRLPRPQPSPPWRPLSSPCRANLNLIPTTTTTPHTSHNNERSSRPFHATASVQAKIAPSTRRKQDRIGVYMYTEDLRFDSEVLGDPRMRLQYLEEYGRDLWIGAASNGVIPRSVSFATFMEVAEQLIHVAYADPPSAGALRCISKDVEMVWKIGRICALGTRDFSAWVTTAAADAGVDIAIFILASRFLQISFRPKRTPILDRVEHMAMRKQDPRAMILHAAALHRRGQTDEAIAMMDEVMSRIYPTKIQPSVYNDIHLDGCIESPWVLQALLKESIGDSSASNEVIKAAALTYQDPDALIRYAQIKMGEGDLEMYEECMSKAATAGNAEACWKLANFYYLTFHGRFPRRGEKKQQKKKGIQNKTASSENASVEQSTQGDMSQRQSSPPKSAAESDNDAAEGEGEKAPVYRSLLDKLSERLSYMFGLSRPKEEYRKLAFYWYNLAANHGSKKAALLFAVLARQDKLWDVGRNWLLLALEDGRLFKEVKFVRPAKLRQFTNELMLNWNDFEFEPKIPPKLLET